MDDSDPDLQYDCIIIGAGLYGIAAANAYLRLRPNDRLVILESSSSIGGVWSHERVYNEFWTQTPINMAMFSSLPIRSLPPHETYCDFFPARHVAQYLSEFVDRQIYAGRSIRERILFNSNVVKVDYSAASSHWHILHERTSRPFSSRKLLVAAGLTSQPNMPELPRQQVFRGPIIHHVDFGTSSILKDPKITHIAVLGGAKSAADVAYAAAKAGKAVSWIIRRSGSGPAHLAPAKGMGPYKNSNELLYTRLTASLSPSIWNRQNWLSRLLHGTSMGRRAVDWIWDQIDKNSRREAGYHRRHAVAGAENGFTKLEPDTSIFWQNDSTGVNQRPDFWDTIAAHVHVYRQDVLRLKERSIVLQREEEEEEEEEEVATVDAIICATGWRPSYENFFSKDLAQDLGLPTPTDSTTQQPDSPEWHSADETAEAEIARLFPRLQHPPPHHLKPTTLTPFRLYRNMIPTNPAKYPGIVFLGHIAVGNNFRCAEVQALWATAHLFRMLTLPSTAEMQQHVALALAWCRKRYLSKGLLGHWLFYDLIPYTDALLEDMGLRSHRRRGGWFGDFWKPCVAADLEGVLAELMRDGGGKME